MGTLIFWMREQASWLLTCLLVYLLVAPFSFPAAAARSGNVSLRIGVYPPSLKTDIKITEPSGNRVLDAAEKGEVLVTIKNEGRGDAFGVQVAIQAISIPKGVSFPTAVTVGTIRAGAEKTVSIPITADRQVETGSCKIELRFREEMGFDADPITLSFTTKEFIPPDLQVADVGIHDFSQNGKIEPGETVEVIARIINMGGDKAGSVRAEVAVGENVFIMPDSKTKFNLGDLAPFEYKDITFTLVTNRRIQTETVPVFVRLRTTRPEDSRETELKQLVLNRPEKPQTVFTLPEKVEGQRPLPDVGVPTLSVDVDLKVPEGKRQNKYGIAVIIGNSEYRSRDVPPVDYAIRDAAVIREYAEKAMGYRPGNIIYVENATQANFRAIFGSETDHRGKLYNYVRPGRSDVFVYYSGHGAPDPSGPTGYFVPVDCDPSQVRLNGYSLQNFSANLAKIPAKSVTVVLDACFSGGSERGMLLRNASPVYFDIGNPLAVLKKAVVFTSSSGDQISSWYPQKRHGLFTYYFLKGLQGESDKNRDGRIDADELFAFVQEEVSYMARRLSGRDQDPQLIGNRDSTIVTLR